MTQQMRVPVAPPKQVQASGELSFTSESRYWQDIHRAGLLPICRATAHVHAWGRSIAGDFCQV